MVAEVPQSQIEWRHCPELAGHLFAPTGCDSRCRQNPEREYGPASVQDFSHVRQEGRSFRTALSLSLVARVLRGNSGPRPALKPSNVTSNEANASGQELSEADGQGEVATQPGVTGVALATLPQANQRCDWLSGQAWATKNFAPTIFTVRPIGWPGSSFPWVPRW